MDTIASVPAPELRIPAGLLPEDGRFGSGPSKVRQEAVERLSEVASGFLGTSHRQAVVRDTVAGIRAGLAELFSLPDGYEVLLGNGGASAFWDAAAFGMIEKRSQHLSFGEFSSKFARVVASTPHLSPPHVIESDPGTHPLPVPDPAVDAYALTHNETSTGVCMTVQRPRGAGGVVLVDATSAAGALPVDPDQFDAYYFSPQKAFGADGGMWVAVCSPAGIARIEEIAASGRTVPAFLDLRLALDNSRQNQTYNTPGLVTLFLLAEQVRWMLDRGGLEWAAGRSRQNAGVLYGWAERSSFARPFVSDPHARSPVTATIDFDEGIDAAALCAALRRNGIVDTEAYRKLGRNQIRVGLWPAIETADVEALTHCVDYVAERLGG